MKNSLGNKEINSWYNDQLGCSLDLDMDKVLDMKLYFY